MSYWTYQIDGDWPDGYDGDIFFETEEEAVASALQKIEDSENTMAEITLFEISYRKTGKATIEVKWEPLGKKK